MTAKRKAEAGLKRVLYVRADDELVDAIESVRRKMSEERPGTVVSQADAVRCLLWQAIGEKP